MAFFTRRPGEEHLVVAGWQLLSAGFSRGQVDTALRGLRRVHRDVCALGDLTELGWYMAAAWRWGRRLRSAT